MFVKNLGNTDVKIKRGNYTYVIYSGAVTYLPDGLFTLTEIQNQYGNCILEVASGNAISYPTEAKALEGNKVYYVSNFGENTRLYANASVDLYGSDSGTTPTDTSTMVKLETFTGLATTKQYPKYILIDAANTVEVVATNIDVSAVE